jgi:hypothetical protein
MHLNKELIMKNQYANNSNKSTLSKSSKKGGKVRNIMQNGTSLRRIDKIRASSQLGHVN